MIKSVTTTPVRDMSDPRIGCHHRDEDLISYTTPVDTPMENPSSTLPMMNNLDSYAKNPSSALSTMRNPYKTSMVGTPRKLTRSATNTMAYVTNLNMVGNTKPASRRLYLIYIPIMN